VIKRTENEDETRLCLDGVVIDGKEEEGKLVAYLPASFCKEVRLSDLVFIQGSVQTRTDLFGKNATFQEYFADDIRFFCVGEKIRVSDNKLDVFANLKELLRARLYEGMSEDAFSVSFAILTGDTSGIEDGLLNNVRKGGIAHIFAVSGLHIGTLYAVCVVLVKKINFLRGKKLTSFCLVVSVLLLYGGLCGYSESVLRAIVMCVALYATKLIGVKQDSLERVSIAAILVLFINPVSLFCVGFQLSFAACYGICFLSNPLQVWLERKFRTVGNIQSGYPVTYLTGTRGKVISFLSVTASAQMATAPILLNAYGYLSAWGFLLNVIFVPVVGFIFSITLGCSALACLLPSLFSSAILWLPNLLWTIGLLFFEAFEFSIVLEGVVVNGLFLVNYYALLVVLSDKFNLKSNEKTVLCLIFALVCVCAFLV
jgi:competence protein ComEC